MSKYPNYPPRINGLLSTITDSIMDFYLEQVINDVAEFMAMLDSQRTNLSTEGGRVMKEPRAKKLIHEVKEVYETKNPNEANRLLQDGWIMLAVSLNGSSYSLGRID